MENISFVVGVIGNIISVLLFLSPVGTFARIVRNRSTEEFASLPYICTLLATSLWTFYGIIRPGALLVATVNGFGAVVQLVYITLFLIFASTPQKRARAGVLFAILDVGFLGVVILMSSFMLESDNMRINMIGFFGAALNIVMYASPLAALSAVVTTGSVEYMPFLLSLCVFLNGGVWTLYAVLVNDIFLGIPNAAGCILGVAQLVVYAIYSRARHQDQEHMYHEQLIP